MKVGKCSICLTFLTVLNLGMSVCGSYTRGLIKYLHQESKLHQVMFIVDDHVLQNSSSSVNFLITDVYKHFPSFSTSLTNLKTGLQKHFPPTSRPPRRTTLFIMILDDKPNGTWGHVTDTIIQLLHLSDGHSHPRCLINILSQERTHSIKLILNIFWLHDIIDVSVLQHSSEEQPNLEFEVRRQPILHEINDFAKTYRAEKVNAQTKWFSNKLLNLHGHRLNFLLMADQYFSKSKFVRENRIADIISRAMHGSFRISTSANHDTNATIKILNQDKFDMLLNVVQVGDVALGLQMIRIVDIEIMHAVIPRTSEFSKVIVISKEFMYMLLTTSIAIVAIRIVAWILKFNNETWQTFNIIQLIMGMSITRNPEKYTEKLVLGILMLNCIVYSGYLYSVILDLSLRPEPQISNLEELANSSLTPMASRFLKHEFVRSPVSYVREIGTKVENVSRENITACLDYLKNHPNVYCFSSKKLATSAIKKLNLNARILQEPMAYYLLTWKARVYSPYLDRFNEVILRASQAGLLYQFLDEGAEELTTNSPPEEVSKEKLLLIATYLLAIGYTLATFTFIIEKFSFLNWSNLNVFRNQ